MHEQPLGVAIAPTFYARRWLGIARWRFFHRFVRLFYGLSVGHALILGVDVGHYTWIRPVIWLAQIPLLALFIPRLLTPRIRREGRLSTARLTTVRSGLYGLVESSCAAIVAFLGIMLSGHSDLIATI